MVTLTISPKRGNHARYFPHSGYLGLTPVVVTGVVETRLEEDNQPIEASRLVVRIRCYEAIGSSLSKGIRPEQQEPYPPSSSSHPIVNNNQFSNVNVLWQTEKTLWTAKQHHPHAGDDEYNPLGDWKGSWKLVIPINAVSNGNNTLPPSSASDNINQDHLDVAQTSGCAIGSITYKAWRSWWQVETVIYHRPAGILGTRIMKSHGLYLINYGEAEKHYSRSLEDSKTSIQSTTRMTHRNLRYSITAPSSACCGDEVELIIRIGSSPTLHQYSHLHQDRAIPPANHHPQLDHQYPSRSQEPIPNIQGKARESMDGPSRSDITLKRLQVSLVRRLAIELVKSSPSNTNSLSARPMEDMQPARNRFINPVIPPLSINTMMNHTSPIGTNSIINNNNSKIQLTSFNTLTTNTEGVSKSNSLFNTNQSVGPASSHLTQEGYDLGFIVKLKIPIVKSKSHYSIGETFKTNSTTVNFFFQFKLSIKNKLTNRIEMIELSDLNVQVFAISKEQIKSALDQLSKFNNSHQNTLVYQNRLLLNPSSSSSNIINNNSSAKFINNTRNNNDDSDGC